MKALIEFIDRVYLASLKLPSQEFFLDALIAILQERKQEINHQRKQTEIITAIEEGEIENPEGYSADEIQEAVEVIRNTRNQWPFHTGKIDYDYWAPLLASQKPPSWKAETQS